MGDPRSGAAKRIGLWVLGGAGLLLAGFCYLFAIILMGEFGNSDPAGNGLTKGFAALSLILLWILIAAFALPVCRRTRQPRFVVPGAIVGLLGSFWFSLEAMGLMDHRTALALTPTLLPPLAAAFVAVMWLGRAWPPRRKWIAAGAIAAATVALWVPPIAARRAWNAGEPAREAAIQRAAAQAQRDSEQALRDEQARFEALGPESKLDDFIEFSYSDSEQGRAALEKLRSAKSRQADAIRLLRGERWADLTRLQAYHLEPTAELCAAYRAGLAGRMEADRTDFSDPQSAVFEYDFQVDNLRWLSDNGCDLTEPAARLLAPIRTLPQDSRPPDLTQVLERIVAAQ
jgi:hypothetical protein